MNLREFKEQFINAGAFLDLIPVIIRTPDGKTYNNCHCHKFKINKDEVLVIDLLDKLKPKFKVGDVVTHVGGLHPGIECTVATVNEEEQYYTYKEVNGHTKFSEQDKLELVKDYNSIPPVEDDTNIASAVKINPSIIPADELRENRFTYDEYTLFVQEIMCAIKTAASQGHNKLHFVIGEKDISTFKLGLEFTNAGYKVDAVISNDGSDTIDIEW